MVGIVSIQLCVSVCCLRFSYGRGSKTLWQCMEIKCHYPVGMYKFIFSPNSSIME